MHMSVDHARHKIRSASIDHIIAIHHRGSREFALAHSGYKLSVSDQIPFVRLPFADDHCIMNYSTTHYLLLFLL